MICRSPVLPAVRATIRPSMRVTLSTLYFAGILVAPILILNAQSPGVRSRVSPDVLERSSGGVRRAQSADKQDTSRPQMRIVTLNLRNVTLRTALETIRTQAEIELLYSERVVPLQRQVSIAGKDIPVLKALETVLRGTDVVVHVASDGQIMLVKKNDRDSVVRETTQPGRGTVMGRIIDLARTPISQATISIEQLKIRVMSDAEGRYQLPTVVAGRHLLMVRMLGYQTQTREIEVLGGDTVIMDFALPSVANHLAEVVTTGSGERQRVEVGNSIATINADEVTTKNFVPTMSDLLVNRAPGLQVVHGSGAVGSAKRIRIRGIQSITGSNDPIVLIDGIRVNTSIGQCRAGLRGVGSERECADVTSRFDDLDPDIVESVDILKGPAASTLYGSDAANGVIVIKTKRGQAGPARWRFRMDNGISLFDSKAFPVLTRALGTTAGAADFRACGLLQLAQGNCSYQDTIFQFSMFRNAATSPLATGRNTAINADVSGGFPTLQYFLAVGYDDRLGNSKMPDVNAAIISRGKGGNPLPRYMLRPNAERRGNGTVRMTGQIGTQADFSFGSELVVRQQRRGNDGMNDAFSFRTPDDTITLSRGWWQFYMERSERTTRSTSSGTVNWRPTTWLVGRGTYGFDFSNSEDKELARRDACVPFCPYQWIAEGEIAGGRTSTSTHTVDIGTTLSIPLRSNIVLRTAAGAQYVKDKVSDFNGYMANLAYGQTDFRNSFLGNSGGSGFHSNMLGLDANTKATAGLYLDQTLSLNNRLFIGGAIRQDMASGLGPDGVRPVYPKLSLSWVASEESFFPWREWMSLRVRSAYGHAGVQPAMVARLRTFESGQTFLNPDGTFGQIATINGIGNHLVRPERTIEREYGFELGLWRDRLRFDVTRYHKNTRDALAQRPVPPSVGGYYMGSTRRSENIGDVRNTGTEVSIDSRIIDRSSIQWNMTVTYASRQNLLVKIDENLYGDMSGGSIGVSDDRVVEGYPLFARWARPILSYGDEDGDGIIGPSEVVVGDSMVYLGPSQPKYDMGIQQSLTAMNGRLQIVASLQYQHGFVQVNQFLANNAQSLAYTQIPGAGTLKQQAFAVAADNSRVGGNTLYGFVERTNILRLNTLGATFFLPDRVARLLRSRSTSIGVLGTNLALWTNYSGTDPETNTMSASGNRLIDGGQIPQPRTWTLRLNLNF
jgi:TonB-linked SusC/RagA family outer membrane protein